MPIFEVITNETTVGYLLDMLDVLDEEDLSQIEVILNKIFGVTNISDLQKASWTDSSLDLITIPKTSSVSKLKLSMVFNVFRTIVKFQVLQGDPKVLTLPDTVLEIQIMSNKVEKGLKNICDLQKLDFPKKLTHKNWQFLKKEIVNTLETYGLDWTIGEESALNKRLSTGVGCWIRKNLTNSNYEFLASEGSSQEIWKNIVQWFGSSELDSNKKSWIRTRLDGIKLDSVANIEKFVNEYTILVNDLKEVQGDDTQADLLTKIRKAAHVTPIMQANAARIGDTSIKQVSELTVVLGKIFVDLQGTKIYTQKSKPPNEQKIRRVESSEKGNILTNYLDKKDYAIILKSLNEDELERFKETREITPKINQIIKENKGKKGSEVQSKAITFSGTTTIIGKRPAPVPNPDKPNKRARADKDKKGIKKSALKNKANPGKDKSKKRKKDTSGSTRRTSIIIGDDVKHTTNEKTVKTVCNLSAKIDSINIGDNKKE